MSLAMKDFKISYSFPKVVFLNIGNLTIRESVFDHLVESQIALSETDNNKRYFNETKFHADSNNGCYGCGFYFCQSSAGSLFTFNGATFERCCFYESYTNCISKSSISSSQNIFAFKTSTVVYCSKIGSNVSPLYYFFSNNYKSEFMNSNVSFNQNSKGLIYTDSNNEDLLINQCYFGYNDAPKINQIQTIKKMTCQYCAFFNTSCSVSDLTERHLFYFVPCTYSDQQEILRSNFVNNNIDIIKINSCFNQNSKFTFSNCLFDTVLPENTYFSLNSNKFNHTFSQSNIRKWNFTYLAQAINVPNLYTCQVHTNYSSTDIFTQSENFLPSFGFTSSEGFQKSEGFTYSYIFSESHIFSMSAEFPMSKEFTKSNKFPISNGFSLSNEFSKSTEFPITKEFTISIKFSLSNEFSLSKEFTISAELPRSKEFTESKIIPLLNRSNFFSESNKFTLSNHFLQSSGFSKSNFFSCSEEFPSSYFFSCSSYFSNSIDFSYSNLFSSSHIFSSPTHGISIDIGSEEIDKNNWKYIAIGCGVLVIVILVVAVILIILIKKKKKERLHKKSNSSESEFAIEEGDTIKSITPTVTNPNPLYHKDRGFEMNDPFREEFDEMQDTNVIIL